MTIDNLVDFLQTMGNLKKELRHGAMSSGRRESVADHSWRLAIMTLLIGRKCSGINTEKAICMALVHDMAEAIIGDVHYTAVTAARRSLEGREFNKFDDLLGEYSSGMQDLWIEFDQNETSEARLVNALDKLEACMQHNESGMKTWPVETSSQIIEYYERIERDFPLVRELADNLKESSLRIFESLSSSPQNR